MNILVMKMYNLSQLQIKKNLKKQRILERKVMKKKRKDKMIKEKYNIKNENENEQLKKLFNNSYLQIYERADYVTPDIYLTSLYDLRLFYVRQLLLDYFLSGACTFKKETL